jgi:hypothetical protein
LRNILQILTPLLGILIVLISLYSNNEARVASSQIDTISFDSDSTRVSRTWTTYDESVQSIKYSLSVTSAINAKEFRNNILTEPKVYTSTNYWNGVYIQIYNEQKNDLNSIITSLKSLQKDKVLNRNQFARVIVSLVQDIPYTLVLSEQKCEDQIEYEGPCVSGVKYGIYTPIEFLSNLKGDCDTRTLLLYTILKQFEYNPIILTSKEYAHSMLALDIQASGDFILHNGRKHYFWETTASGWDVGVLPPTTRNKNYWKKTVL